MRVAFALACLVLTSCPKPILQALGWQPFPGYSAPEVAALVAHEPASLLQGDAAPWDGVLLHPDDLAALLDDRERLLEALQISYTGRGEDRAYADSASAACQSAVRVCRDNQPRLFLVGMGAGAGSCAAVAIGAASRP